MTSILATDLGPLSEDWFLGGRLRIAQPQRGFRSGPDAVFLAAAVDAAPGETLLDLGCGAGVAMLCAAVRLPGLVIAGVEVQPGYAALARSNTANNGLASEVFATDLRALPRDLLSRRFNHVIANPPYHPAGSGKAATDAGRDLARSGETPLADWLAVASRRLAPNGRFAMIQRIDRLREALASLPPSLGTVTVLPLVSRAGRPPQRFILRARKGGRGAFRLAAPFVVHAGPAHRDDSDDDFSCAAQAILRDGAKLDMTD